MQIEVKLLQSSTKPIEMTSNYKTKFIKESRPSKLAKAYTSCNFIFDWGSSQAVTTPMCILESGIYKDI